MATRERQDCAGTSRAPRISRRAFIELAAASAVGLLVGCVPAQVSPPQSTVAPTDAPAPAPTPEPTDVPPSAATPAPDGQARRPDVIKFYPDAPSTVVRTRHAGVWADDELVPEAIDEMLDASVSTLTDLPDARDAWAALFAPDERVAIKVNAIRTGVTHVPLVMAIAGRLQAVGLPPEQIVIFDRGFSELEGAGYTLNLNEPGVRCHGTIRHEQDWELLGTRIGLSDVLLGCDALINVPILKVAPGAPGISFAMKNHYGTFDRPAAFHNEQFAPGVAALNALAPIKDRTRLIVGDVLTVDAHRDSAYYQVLGIGHTILAGFDPVAHDAVGLQMAEEALTAEGQDPTATTTRASAWLAGAAELGVGTDQADDVDLVAIDLV